MTFGAALDKSNSSSLEGQILFGIVVSNLDPLFQSRLQIRISLLHQGYPDSALPWVLPIQSNMQGNAPGVGGCNVPVTGSKVAVFFPEDDATNTYYLGSTTTGSSVLVDFKENYPYVYGWTDSLGNLFKVDTVVKTWTYNMVDGTYLQFANGTLNIVATQAININVEGNCSINATGVLNLTGSTINLNSGPNPASELTPIVREIPEKTTFNGQTNY